MPTTPVNISLYIGHHKVGSTALQIYLAQNFSRLLSAGILYPFTEMQGAANAVSKLLRGDSVVSLPFNVREAHSALAYRMMADAVGFAVPPQFPMLPHSQQMLHALRSQISALRPQGVILCSEAFSNFGQFKPQLISELCRQFPDASFNLYCALRRPDEYIVAWHGQRIKVGEICAPLREGAWKQYKNSIHFNYRMALEPWLEQVPRPVSFVRDYQDVLAAGGSEADFIAHSGLKFPDGMIPTHAANKSIPLSLLEIARCGNSVLPRAQASELVQFLINLDKKVEVVPSNKVEMLGDKIRQDIYRSFIPIHSWLSGIKSGTPFFPDIDEILNPKPVPEMEAVQSALSMLSPDITRILTEPVQRFLRAMQEGYRVQ